MVGMGPRDLITPLPELVVGDFNTSWELFPMHQALATWPCLF